MRISRPEALLAIACTMACASAAAAEFGTLFSSPQERERLDKLRRGDPPAAAAVSVNPQVTGFVRRSDGRSTVWINGVPVLVAGPAAEALTKPGVVRTPGEGEVKLERTRRPEVKR